MDSQEKQELKKNDLESFLHIAWRRIQKYGAYILLGFALLFLAFQLWQRHKAAERAHIEDANGKLAYAKIITERAFLASAVETSENPVDLLTEIFNQYSDVRPAAAEARLELASYYNNLILSLRAKATKAEITPGSKEITRAQAIEEQRAQLNAVIQEYPEFPSRVVSAKLKMGALLETEGKFVEAKKLYEEIASDSGQWAKSPYAAEAKRKLAALSNNEKFIKKVADTMPAATEPASSAPAATAPVTSQAASKPVTTTKAVETPTTKTAVPSPLEGFLGAPKESTTKP